MQLVIKTFKEQQRFHDHGPYSFQRKTSWATDGVPLGGYGYPVKPDGLICSMFRPSDDATIYPYLIPSNLFAIESLAQMKEITQTLTRGKHIAADAELLAKTVRKALQENAKFNQRRQYC